MSKFQAKYIKPELKLFDNQKYNIKELVHRKRCILSDKCGGGKTASVIYAFSYLKEKQCVSNLLVLTPLSAHEKLVWKSDTTKFTTFRAISLEQLSDIVQGSEERLSRALESYSIIYGKHTSVKQDSYSWLLDKLISNDNVLFCVDEVHAFRNPKSALTLNLAKFARNSTTFWGITATTISRSIENLYNITNLIYPWYLGPWSLFRDTYCNTAIRTFGYDHVNHRKRQAIEVISLKDPEGLQLKMKPILIAGASFLNVKYKYVDYKLSDYEQSMYTRIARGIGVDLGDNDEDWYKSLFTQPRQSTTSIIGDVEKYSSRFIYLQHAADGIIAEDGSYTRFESTKVNLLLDLIYQKVAKKQSILVYFDYLASVDIIYNILAKQTSFVTLTSTGSSKLKPEDLTEAKCAQKPHVVLCTRAASESASYYFINNVVFFHCPTVPSTFIQMLGRITRKNTKYPDDLNCYIFKSDNIDLYKLIVVSTKTKLMEIASGEHENNVPDDYKTILDKNTSQSSYRKILLWQ